MIRAINCRSWGGFYSKRHDYERNPCGAKKKRAWFGWEEKGWAADWRNDHSIPDQGNKKTVYLVKKENQGKENIEAAYHNLFAKKVTTLQATFTCSKGGGGVLPMREEGETKGLRFSPSAGEFSPFSAEIQQEPPRGSNNRNCPPSTSITDLPFLTESSPKKEKGE